MDDPFWYSATLARTNKACPRTAVVNVSASRLDTLCFITFTSSLSSNAFTHLHVAEIQCPAHLFTHIGVGVVQSIAERLNSARVAFESERPCSLRAYLSIR